MKFLKMNEKVILVNVVEALHYTIKCGNVIRVYLRKQIQKRKIRRIKDVNNSSFTRTWGRGCEAELHTG